MKFIIYGKNGCPYCDRAKELAEKVKTQTEQEPSYEYSDIYDIGWSTKELSEKAGKSVTTVPQIWEEESGTHIGGYSEFNAYIQRLITKDELTFK